VSNSCPVSCGVSTARQRLQDLQALARTHRQIGDARVQVHRQAAAGHQRVEPATQRGARRPQPPVRLGAEQHVVQRRERVDQHEVLVHHADAERDRVARVADACRPALDLDLAAVGLVEAVQDRHQGRLAGAVLADDAVHAARGHRERDVAVGVHRAEALVDVAHRHCGGRRGGLRHVPRPTCRRCSPCSR
jgi:hypothetical protein